MPKLSARRIQRVNKVLDLAAADGVPSDGTPGQRLAWIWLDKFRDHVGENPDVIVPGPDLVLINSVVDSCLERLQPKR